VLKVLLNEIWNCNCPKLEIPNGTWVAGLYGMLQSLLRNKHLLENVLKYNWKSLGEISQYVLMDEEWIGVSQIE
jgi:hypothetical protein